MFWDTRRLYYLFFFFLSHHLTFLLSRLSFPRLPRFYPCIPTFFLTISLSFFLPLIPSITAFLPLYTECYQTRVRVFVHARIWNQKPHLDIPCPAYSSHVALLLLFLTFCVPTDTDSITVLRSSSSGTWCH